MANLKNHPGKYLRDDAAASLVRLEADHGVISVNSAGRTVGEQQALINRWNRGGAANRPPNLYQPQTPASASNHVKSGCVAIDTSHITLLLKIGRAYGWTRPFAGDPVHFEYNPALDTKKGNTSSAGSTATPISGSSKTKREQEWLNKHRKEKLVPDGKAGDATKAAYRRYQTFLRTYGYAGALDGIWGTGMQKAHTKYNNALKAKAQAAAKAKPKSKATIRKGARGRSVVELQYRLNGRYPAYSKLKADGIFGTAVENVVKEFQRRAGLPVNGIVNSKTWRALGF